MKKIIGFIVVVALLAGGWFYYDRYQSVNKDVVQNSQPAKEFKIGEPVESGGITTTVNSAGAQDKVEGYNGDKPAADETYYMVDLTIKNTGQAAKRVNLHDFVMIEKNWVGDVNLELFHFVNKGNETFASHDLKPGEEIKGKIAYVIPKEHASSPDLHVQIPAKIFETSNFTTKKEVKVTN